MPDYFLGIDIGGSKSHALIVDDQGKAVGFGRAGAGNWEGVGYPGLTAVLKDITGQALTMAGLAIEQVAGAGMGMGGYDWPSQRTAHLEAIAPLGLCCPLEIVNDASLGIWAGTAEGWGISIVAGSGCNVRGLSRDRRREGRMVGGAEQWSGEWVGGYGLVCRAFQAVTFEWNRCGPPTALSPAFLEKFHARDLAELIEGVYLGEYSLKPDDARLVFTVASLGDPAALQVVKEAGETLGRMAVGVVHQVGLETEDFEVVLIGSLHQGHPLMTESILQVIHQAAPGARLVRLNAPPVAGGALLGMHMAGVESRLYRLVVINSLKEFSLRL